MKKHWWERGKKEPEVPPIPAKDQEEVFSRSRIASITFTIDRLPFLKNLLARYEAAVLEQQRRFTHDSQLRELLGPVAREFSYVFQDELREQSNNPKWKGASPDTRILHLIATYAGTLLTKLEDLRAKGWDGQGLRYEGHMDSYRADAIWRLRALVDGLEAGNAQVTLNIPAELQSEYEGWLTEAIVWAVREGRGPASPENK